MNSKKYIPIVLMSAMFLGVNGASAKTLLPSLLDQMDYQIEINKSAQIARADMQNDAVLAAIRNKNLSRMESIATNEQQSTSKIDEQARAAALAWVVTRKPITEESVQAYSSASTHVTFSRTERQSSSRIEGNIDMRRVEEAWLGWVNNLRKEQ